MQTNLEGVYAVGDVAESFHVITGKPIYRPMATTANKMGRIAGDAMTGGMLRFQGILGTGILRFFDLTIAQTGLTETEARAEGYEVAVLFNIKPDKPGYMAGQDMVIKAIADKLTHRILGVQIIGPQGVDKRIDVFASTITLGVKAEDLFHLDLAYAPPFSTTKDAGLYGYGAVQCFKYGIVDDPSGITGFTRKADRYDTYRCADSRKLRSRSYSWGDSCSFVSTS